MSRDMMLDTVVLALAMAATPVRAQFVTGQEEARLRALIPHAEYRADAAVRIYTEQTMPPCFEHEEHFHDAYHNFSGEPSEPFGNANREFPWGLTPGGTHRCDNVTSFKFLRLPPATGSGQATKPIVWWRARKHEATAMGPGYLRSTFEGNGYAWRFPRGTLLGEVLLMRSPAGRWVAFELRTRERAARHWSISVWRPFPTAEHLAGAIQAVRPDWANDAELAAAVGSLRETRHLVAKTLADHQHPTRRAFEVRAEVDVLPRLAADVVDDLLARCEFDEATGLRWRGDCFAPTTDDPWHIVPARYDGTFLGTDDASCRRCHENAGQHVSYFAFGRDWYGHIRGCDGVLSCHPVAPRSIANNGGRWPVVMRDLPGVFEKHDAARHAAADYQSLEDAP